MAEVAEETVKSKVTPKVVTRKQLTETVKEAIANEKVKANTVFIAGVTKAKEYKGVHQMMLEVVQKKRLAQQGKISVTSAANAGDDRFGANTRTVRVWMKVTERGFNNIFKTVAITGEQLQELTKDLKKEEVLHCFARIPYIEIEGEREVPTISIKQYSAEGGLPNRIQKILDIEESERTDDQDKDLKGLEMRLNDEPLVDTYGNQVYELNELTYGEEENIIIKKMPLSEYKKAKTSAKTVTKDAIKDEIGDLVD